MMITGTVKFEKYNKGKPFRTVFLTVTRTGISNGSGVSIGSSHPLFFRPMYEGDTLPTSNYKLVVRSYEVYSDSDGDTDVLPDADDSTTEVYERLARIASVNTTNTNGYDLQRVQDDVGVVGDTLTFSSSTNTFKLPSGSLALFKNLLNNDAQFRFVIVCDAEFV